MLFDSIAKFFDRIESTRKRLEIHQIMCEFFREIKKSNVDIKKIVYLFQGRLDSNIEGTKFGLAEKIILQAIASASGTQLSIITKKYKESGEIGDFTRKTLASGNKNSTITSFFGIKESLTLEELYMQLKKIASITGTGSNQKKIELISSLFGRVTPVATKYITNLLLGRMRVGVAEPSIMDAIAEVFLGDKNKRELIESKYNIYPDLGYIASLCSQGEEKLCEVSITIGVPIRMMLAKRLPYQQIPQKLGGTFIAEYKYDGERIQVHKKGDRVDLFSRHLKNVNNQYPDIIQYVKESVKQDCIFEGECVAVSSDRMLPFQVVSTRRRKYNIEEMMKTVPVKLFVFDLLYCDGIEYMNKPYSERLIRIQEIIPNTEGIQPAHHKRITSLEEMIQYFHNARNDGAEGIMNKDIRENSVYLAGSRGFKWIKMKGVEGSKMGDSIDTVIIGANYGKGKRGGIFGAFYLAIWNEDTEKFEYLTKCGSGFSDVDLEIMGNILKDSIVQNKDQFVECNEKVDVWFTPSVIVEVIGDELTKSEKSMAGYNGEYGYSLRFPIFQRVREDKGIEDITTSQEIIELYNSQM